MTTETPSPQEQLKSEITQLQSSVTSLQGRVQLASVRDEVEDLDTLLAALKSRIGTARGRGYVLEKELEARLDSLASQWAKLSPTIQKELKRQAAALAPAMKAIEPRMTTLVSRAEANTAAAQSLAAQIKAEIRSLEGKAAAAESSLRGMFDTLKDEAGRLDDQVGRIEWMLARLAEAKFQLLPTECGIAAVEAKWDRDGKDDPRGILYLTDQRLLFEQKEEVATKKFLFITTEKEMVQKLLLEIPVAQISDVQASKRGLLGHEDHLDVTAPSGAAHFHINGQESQLWQGLIGRARARDFDQNRTVALDTALLDRAKAAPTRCPTCGGTLDQPVLRGQESLTCGYCGSTVRW